MNFDHQRAEATRHERSIYTEGLNRHSGSEMRLGRGHEESTSASYLGQPCRSVAAEIFKPFPTSQAVNQVAREPSHGHRARPFAGEPPKRIGEAARATKRALSRKLVPRSTDGVESEAEAGDTGILNG